VWLAADADGQPVALKFGPRVLIQREFARLSALVHPHIVRVLEFVDDAVDSGLVLEYLSGGDLVSLTGELPAYWLEAIADLIGVLTWLHARGIVHRDVKARNLMFDAAGRARLIDFGSAAAIGDRWTAVGTTFAAVDPRRGTGPVTAADDVYALAALVHELMYGAPPDARPGAVYAAPAAARELAHLVAGCLDGGEVSARPTLSHFATVIESLLGHQGSRSA
jgi:serine/threonine protein kinase